MALSTRDEPGRESALEIIRAYPELSAVYLLHEQEFADEPEESTLEQFFRWFIDKGSKRYRFHPWPHPLLEYFEKRKNQEAENSLQRINEGQSNHLGVPPVTLVGFASGALGLGEDLRTLLSLLIKAGVPTSVLDVTPPGIERIIEVSDLAPFVRPVPIYETIIFCLPVFETARLFSQVGEAYFRDHYKIGYFQWELTRLPSEWCNFGAMVDEVWCATSFQLDSFARSFGKEPKILPLFVETSVIKPKFSLGDLGIQTKNFTTLTMFDMNSTVARKNPLGNIAAFHRAFPGDNDVGLVVKTTHGRDREDFSALVQLAKADPRVTIVDGVMSRPETLALIGSCDAFLSLHRAEGFGRILAESLALGTPVVATGWSGSSDFLTDQTGFPVRYQLRKIKPGEYPFSVGQWAEPNVDHAASLLHSVRRDPARAARLTSQGRKLIRKIYGSKNVTETIMNLLRELPR